MNSASNSSVLDRFEDSKSTLIPYRLFLVYLISFFLHLPSRLSFLGTIRFDFLLVLLISFYIIGSKSIKPNKLDPASKYLFFIFVYAIVTLPLVEWPGSVIREGLIAFIKGAIFYFFTVNLVVNERRLKAVVFVFVICNLIRVVEPLFMHLTTGYLGSETYLGMGEFAGRLSGAPSDVINPNGLAFVIATIFPFLHYVFSPLNSISKSMYLAISIALIYTMVLTLSRSGALALLIIAFGVFLKSNRKGLLTIIGLAGIAIIYSNLDPIEKDRYLSIVSDDARQSATAEGRIDGWFRDFRVAMNRPIVGHGLGTSREASWNVAGEDKVSHILWAEIWQEIGIIGLALFLLYLRAMVRNFLSAGQLIKRKLPKDDFLYRANEAMQVWLLMNLLFSLASYGLKSYEWYFFGGLSVVLLKMANKKVLSDERGGVEVTSQLEIASKKFPLLKRLKEYK
ncbi:O-antigen ligase family protein [Marinobacter sp. R17]|uniref:O-antigen ligase family protein n=1 Tax=Marinobacter sp. R17 TaxID=2484250 RepID=UPI00168020E2|nr:O-antigen ligase family protein [Marinobacter sp. R17]